MSPVNATSPSTVCKVGSGSGGTGGGGGGGDTDPCFAFFSF